ncbi:MAG: methyltransferase domain-containing protein [Clostridia bacterium]|nr:methyltransferase domain-containing protein [Clostridia bacterium]
MDRKNIDGGRTFDFGKTASAYALYRDIYPRELYDRLRAFGVAADGTSWLDLGTGTGVLPRNLYNEKAKIVGADISAQQITFAKAEAASNGWNIAYLVAPAESTGLPDGSFDAITAAQCFWYFDREKMRAEIARLLKEGGIFVKIAMDWEPDDPIAARSIALVREYNPEWTGGKGIGADIFDDLFPGRRTETFSAELPFTRESWHGRMCACRGTLASMDEETFRRWENEHLLFLRQCPESFTVRHTIYLSRFIPGGRSAS